MKNIFNLLRENPYPGRGIIVGCSEDGNRMITLYFIMGRSENSRNRIFVKTDDGIRTKAFDPSKLTDPSLIIYAPVRTFDNHIIITNGDQTDTVYDFLSGGLDFRSALLRRRYEPDVPNYTPRISALVKPDYTYSFSILKKAHTGSECCLRSFFEYSDIVPGLGHFISTYEKDGDPLPSFTGEPIPVNIDVSDGFENFANEIWNALNEDNKVSLYARETHTDIYKTNEIIINKHHS